ncbi:hypothetical protein [Flavobacterium aquidurense]|uniref:Putative transmembrane protein n=1 Tax=Flavobacterium aquidurense TaxID=362413 RepID=A0A0Q0SDX4_9FLAO|nr:hypothetical protein [Flavobacterium aquidurense]KQB42982.1 putative transmembrane protein [Flavobacterium aquidurense]
MKKNFAIAFGALYMLFFAIPFPMLIYYAVNSEFDVNTLKDKNPWLALSILSISVVLWLIVLIGYFRKWIVQIFISKRNIEQLKSKGIVKEAKILSVVKTSKPDAKFSTYELELLFKNLADTEITSKTSITDAKPHERRFEVEKKINLILNRDAEKAPHFIISTTEVGINGIRVLGIVLGWLLFVAAVIGYYAYSYQTESFGMGWRFISFGHPLFVCPLVLLFFRYILKFIYSKLTDLSGGSSLIKFKGVKTWAKLIKVSQTGIYINDQPEVRFELEYTDNKQDVHRNSLKKVIGLLELDITKQEQIEIFYLPENPSQIAFFSDLENIE